MTTRTRWLGDIRADVNAARARATTLAEDIASLRDRATEQNRSLTDGEDARIERLQKGYDRALEEEHAFEDEAKGMILELSQRAENTEYLGDSTIGASIHDAGNERLTGRHVSRSQLEGAALRAVERHKDVLTAPAADRLDALIRDADTDPQGLGAAYIRAIADPAYARGFWKILRSPSTAPFDMTADEAEAVRNVRQADSMRALSLTGASGGFAVPFALDPSIMNTSNGVTNPLREIARKVTISVDEWRGVSSAGVTASYAAEATETGDNAPTLAQPTISTEKAQAFIPFSIEVGGDWTTLESEMGTLLADAKDTLEADKFVNGTGTNEPFGLLTGVTNTITATSPQTYDVEDLYRLIEALPPRFQPNATFLGSNAILNRTYRLTPSGSTTEPQAMPTREGPILGKRQVEQSTMPATTATGVKFLVVGDFSRFVIVDRIGLTIELVQHLVGTNHRPTGQRGLYCYFRNSSKVVDASAFRALLGIA